MSAGAIRVATTPAEVARCYAVMRELRPHLSAEEFERRVALQSERAGYALAYVEDDGRVVAVAGFRFADALAWGHYLYVDDLVTAEVVRSRGHGGMLLDWLVALARERDCDELHLDSGVQRFAAHRFYLTKRMNITSHHFALRLRG
ncbi:MAG TPA: GNAT family N-acetyltransferase [Candidatus Polarisedimenticolaceae bacterium]|nr:GNAT family N-acetyltransferase [Candidatus Polarisedimenticolaceae bacterium]